MDISLSPAKRRNYESHPSLEVMRYWIGKQIEVKFSWLQCQFNLNYRESLSLVELLIADGTLQPKFKFDIVNEGYMVLRKTYHDELHP